MARITVLDRDGVPAPMRLAAAAFSGGRVFSSSSWFQIERNAVGVVTPGSGNSPVDRPGLHWKIPFGVEAERGRGAREPGNSASGVRGRGAHPYDDATSRRADARSDLSAATSVDRAVPHHDPRSTCSGCATPTTR
jgi:hypothetical protein